MLYARTLHRNLRRQLKRDFKSDESPYNEQDLLDALNVAARHIATRAMTIRVSTSFDAPSTAPTAGDTAAYALKPADVIKVYAAQYNDGSDNITPLSIYTTEELDRDQPGWREYDTADTPTAIYEEQSMWGTYPQMETTNAGTVYVHYYSSGREILWDESAGARDGTNQYILNDTTRSWDTDVFVYGKIEIRQATGSLLYRVYDNDSTNLYVASAIPVPAVSVTLPSGTLNYTVESACSLNDSYERAIYELAKHELTGDERYEAKFEKCLATAKVASKRSIRMRAYG